MKPSILAAFWVICSINPVFAEVPETRITLVLGGDVMLGRLIDKRLEAQPSATLWGNIQPVLAKADATLINQEFAIADTKTPPTPLPKAFYFRAGPKAIDVLQSAGIDYVSLANNHTLDFGTDGLNQTLALLDRNGIAHAGAGFNLEEAQKPAVIQAGEMQIAVIAITDNMPAWRAESKKPGVFYLPIEAGSVPLISQLASQARHDGADFVILSAHWGGNWVERPSGEFRDFAHRILNGGIDLVHGHSGHVIQGIEIYKGKPIFYNMGDLIDDYAVDPLYRNDLAYVARVTVVEGLVKEIEVIPTAISRFQVNRAKGKDSGWVYERLKKMSLELGTPIQRKENSIFVGAKP